MNAQNPDDPTRLHSACYDGNLEVARELLDRGASVNTRNNQGETPLHQVSRGQYRSEEGGVGIVQLLLGRRANIDARDKGRTTPLHLASYYGRVEIVRELLERGATVFIRNKKGQTPLHLVLEGNCNCRDGVSIVRLLLALGRRCVDVDALDRSNETPLHLACKYGKFEIALLLLKHGARVDTRNIQYQTPLHQLSLSWPWRFEEVVRIATELKNRDADINARGKNHETPLHMAYRNYRLEIAQWLLQNGADKDAKNNKGETPSQLALRVSVSPVE